MKTNQKVAVSIFVLMGFVVGLVIGVSLTNPGMSLFEAAGTIGKIDKYRNVKITEKDIELRNDLLADETLREAYKDYLTFEYTASVKMAEDIQYSLEAIRDVPAFRAANPQTIARMEEHQLLLDHTRMQLLEAISVLQNLHDMEKIAVHNVLNNAASVLSQNAYRNYVLFDYIDGVEQFVQGEARGEFSRLERSHDLLYANLLSSSIINDNKLAIRYLMYDKELLTRNENLAMDRQALQARVAMDIDRSERRLMDVDTELLFDAKQLGVFWAVDQYAIFDAEQMESLFQLQTVRSFDTEQLESFMRNEGFRTREFSNMEVALWDIGKLDHLLQAREQLEMISMTRHYMR